ncbi:MAG TPA: hypothetical protein VIL55_11460 [Naasia sp.]|jgi:hypothetical protein
MRKKQLSDADIRAVLEGRAPQRRAELEELAAVVDSLRLSSFETPPRPSAGLAARLDTERVAWISEPAGGLPAQGTEVLARSAELPARGKRMFFSWFTGLGLVAKLAIGGAAVAVAATAGTVGAGAAGVLPPAVQSAYDDAVTPVETPTPEPTEGADSETEGERTVPDGTQEPVVEDGTGDEVVVPAEDDASGPKTAHAQAVTEAAHRDLEPGEKRGEIVRDAAHSGKSGHEDADEADDSGADSPSDLDDSDDDASGDSDDDSDDDSDSDSSGSGSSDSGSGSANSGKGKSGK